MIFKVSNPSNSVIPWHSKSNRTSSFAGGRLLGWPHLLWKLLPQVPKQRPRLHLWVLVTQHFEQACKIWGSLSSTPFRFFWSYCELPSQILTVFLLLLYNREFNYQLIADNHISAGMPATTLDPNAFWDAIWNVCLLLFHHSNPFSRCAKDCTRLQHAQQGKRWLTETGEKSQI